MNNNIYRGSVYQAGYGLGGTFRKFFKWIIPIFKKHALPTLESGAKAIGKTALTAAADIARDVVAGRNVREASREHMNSAVDSLKERAERTLDGKGIKLKKKQKFKKFVVLKQKQNFNDIFD
jgi:predicted Ser/Thr protein kinase